MLKKASLKSKLKAESKIFFPSSRSIGRERWAYRTKIKKFCAHTQTYVCLQNMLRSLYFFFFFYKPGPPEIKLKIENTSLSESGSKIGGGFLPLPLIDIKSMSRVNFIKISASFHQIDPIFKLTEIWIFKFFN